MYCVREHAPFCLVTAVNGSSFPAVHTGYPGIGPGTYPYDCWDSFCSVHPHVVSSADVRGGVLNGDLRWCGRRYSPAMATRGRHRSPVPARNPMVAWRCVRPVSAPLRLGLAPSGRTDPWDPPSRVAALADEDAVLVAPAPATLNPRERGPRPLAVAPCRRHGSRCPSDGRITGSEPGTSERSLLVGHPVRSGLL
jgi:hypothetical protein